MINHFDASLVLTNIAEKINANSNDMLVSQMAIVNQNTDLTIAQKNQIQATLNSANVPVTPSSLSIIRIMIESIIDHLEVNVPLTTIQILNHSTPGIITQVLNQTGVGSDNQIQPTVTGIIDGSNKRFVLSKEPLSGSAIEIYNKSLIYDPSSITMIDSVTFDLPTAPLIGDSLIAIITLNVKRAMVIQVSIDGVINGINKSFTLGKNPVPGSLIRIYKDSQLYDPSTVSAVDMLVTLPFAPLTGNKLIALITSIPT